MEELAQIEACVDSLMGASGIARTDVDMVFLTGGSSIVPAVRRIFESRFGPAHIRSGNEFTSVARGLASRRRTPERLHMGPGAARVTHRLAAHPFAVDRPACAICC